MLRLKLCEFTRGQAKQSGKDRGIVLAQRGCRHINIIGIAALAPGWDWMWHYADMGPGE